MLYYDQIFHVAFEAGITLPGGGTSQSVALADDAPAVPQIGGVRRVDNIEASSHGVKLTLGETRVLVPWPKVRQCSIRLVEQQPTPPYIEGALYDSRPKSSAPGPVDVPYTQVSPPDNVVPLTTSAPTFVSQRIGLATPMAPGPATIVEAVPAKAMTAKLPYKRAKDR